MGAGIHNYRITLTVSGKKTEIISTPDRAMAKRLFDMYAANLELGVLEMTRLNAVHDRMIGIPRNQRPEAAGTNEPQ